MTDDLQDLPPDEGIERFIRHREPSVRPSTLRNARTRLNFFQAWCAEREIENLNDLTGRDLSDFVAWRRGDIAAITLQKQLSTIRKALRYWADIEGVREGLAEKVHSPELPDGAESREEHLDAERAEAILEYYNRYHRGSRTHAILTILWRTGMRRSALRSLDVDDLQPDDHAMVLRHRPEEGTRLKNGENGERWVWLRPRHYEIVDAYLQNPDRHDVTDDYGREPLVTSRNGRPCGSTIYDWVNKATRPCEIGGCPHDRDPDDCEAVGGSGVASKCPSSRSPHDVRRGSITTHLNESTPPETVSERMDVSLDVLYEHYDARTAREKMEVRKNHLK